MTRLLPRLLPQSLRARLVAVSVLTTMLLLAAAAAIAVWEVRRATTQALTAASRSRLASVREDIDRHGHLRADGAGIRTATFVQVLDGNGNVVFASPTLSGVAPLVPFTVARRGLTQAREITLSTPDVDLAVVSTPQPVDGRAGALIVALESQGFLDARQQLQIVLAVGVPIVVLFTGLLAWFLTGRTLRSVARLAEEADALSMAESGRELSVDSQDAEVVRLVAALNRMLARLDTHYATNLAAASETTHRLRTPLATLRAEAELALASGDAPAVREALTRIIGDADRLTGLVNHLLSTAGRVSEPVTMEQVQAQLGNDWLRQGRARGQAVQVTTAGAGEVDQGLLRAVVDPLLENALEHAAGPEPVTVDIDVHDGVVVRVSNSGPGVPGSLIDRLFEPWTGTTNSGLGLWLSREAARAAAGDVVCVSPGPPTTVFEATLPRVVRT